MLIDKERLIEELRGWQRQIAGNRDIYADIVDTFVDVVINKINAQPAVKGPELTVVLESGHLINAVRNVAEIRPTDKGVKHGTDAGL